MKQSYSFLVQSIGGLSWKPGLLQRRAPNLYVAIDLDGVRTHRTHTTKRDLAPKWNDISTLSSDNPSSTLLLCLYHDTSFPGKPDTCLKTLDINIDDLLELCAEEKVVNLKLNGELYKQSAVTLAVQLGPIGPTEAGTVEIINAQRDIENLAIGAVGSRRMDTAPQSQADQSALLSALGIVISKLDIIVRMGDEIAKIHPYANVAWQVLTSTYKAVKTQQETDNKLAKLVQTMAEVYSFVGDVESLAQKIKRLEDTVLEIQQTVECAIFIRENTGTGFCGRLVGQVWSDASGKIDSLSAALLKVKQNFDDGLAIQTAFVSMKTLEEVGHLGTGIFSPHHVE
ncbi:hypothetical protein B0H10DRAFT_2225724 [Mycena sp. CBHHK59/15]|nr:hypothetical protein B0H10DRAFT_2225724 [Mycena sp. CBHHK59/15]